jgi:hypothetical protein
MAVESGEDIWGPPDLSLAQEMPLSPLLPVSDPEVGADDVVAEEDRVEKSEEEKKKNVSFSKKRKSRAELNKQRAKEWIEENKKELKRMKRRAKEEVYNINDLSSFKKELMKANRGAQIIYTYNLPLFDFVGSSTITFNRIANFDNCYKGHTDAGVEKLKEMAALVGTGEDAVLSPDDYSILEQKFSRRWWKLVNEGVNYGAANGYRNTPGSGVRDVIGQENIKCILVDVQADLSSSVGKGNDESGGEKIVFVRPICKWSVV